MPSKSSPRFGFNELSGPAATAAIAAAVLFIGLAGYFIFIRDNHKKQTQTEVNSEMAGSLESAQQKFQQEHFGAASGTPAQGATNQAGQAGVGALDRLHQAPASSR